MTTLSDYHFWFSSILFFIAVFCSFYLPGFLVIRLVDRKINATNIILSFCVGFVLWTMQGYVFGYLHMRFLTYVYLAAILIFSYKNYTFILQNIRYAGKIMQKNKIIISIILAGMIAQTMDMFGSGLVSNDGIRFLGSNGVDGIMHLSYIQALSANFPPIEPGAYGIPLKNYHYWIDLNIAELTRIWQIPEIYIFFQFMPLFISVITGVATFLVMRLWSKSKSAGIWALFFLYLAGDGAYLFMLYLHHIFGFYTPAIDNGMTQFLNMPHVAAKMIFIAGLIPFYIWIKTAEKKWGYLMILLFVSLVGFKIYYGVFVGFGLFLLVLTKIFVSLYKQRKTKSFIFKSFKQQSFSVALLAIFGIIGALIYLPPNSGSGGLLWYPLEWPKQFLGQSNLDIREWWLRMQVYEQAKNIRNIIVYDAFAVVVTLICIQGTRLIGFIPTKRLAKLLGWEHLLFFIPGIILFHFLGLFTLQAAGSFNVFNFFVVSSVIMSLFSAYLCYELMKKKKVWSVFLLVIIVLITIPRSVYEIYSVVSTINNDWKTSISKDELDGLAYIKNNTPKNSIIQSHINNPLDARTTYVSYFSERQTYLSGITMIASHNEPIEPLQKELKGVFKIQNSSVLSQRLKDDKITYLYFQKAPDQLEAAVNNKSLFEKIYENASVIIYKIK